MFATRQLYAEPAVNAKDQTNQLAVMIPNRKLRFPPGDLRKNTIPLTGFELSLIFLYRSQDAAELPHP